MNQKPEFRISPDDKDNPLPALNSLSTLKPHSSFHDLHDCRHPLGIYNISIERILRKIDSCIDHLLEYWQSDGPNSKKIEKIIDYLELSLYAAAEHIDDVNAISNCFFNTKRECAKSADVRHLKSSIKPIRDEISNFTNTIKHSSGRIRVCELGFSQGSNKVTLIGFFIEAYSDGAIRPNPILHKNGKKVISITTLLWEIILFLRGVSVELDYFLQQIGASKPLEGNQADFSMYRDVIVKLSSLPLYTFDEDHPFRGIRLTISMDSAMKQKASSNIYGSILSPWSKVMAAKFGELSLRFGGDGISTSFETVTPSNLSICHWD